MPWSYPLRRHGRGWSAWSWRRGWSTGQPHTLNQGKRRSMPDRTRGPGHQQLLAMQASWQTGERQGCRHAALTAPSSRAGSSICMTWRQHSAQSMQLAADGVVRGPHFLRRAHALSAHIRVYNLHTRSGSANHVAGRCQPRQAVVTSALILNLCLLSFPGNGAVHERKGLAQ